MNKFIIQILKRCKKIYTKLYQSKIHFGASYEYAQYKNQEASDIIKKRLLDDQPLMVCRFGSVELNCILNYLAIAEKKSILTKSVNYIKGLSKTFWWEKEIVEAMCNNAGFFPKNIQMLQQFCIKMLDDMTQIDILGSWLKEEKLVDQYLHNIIKIRLPDLEPYCHENPWSEVLKDKIVLVVHPYEESIKMQYKKRKYLFEDERVLPQFELKTIKAVQSIANNKTPFKTWFDAYDSMCEQITNTNFDVAVIGCGAYGLPLAAYVKKIGKKAIHLGGATQILFGIKGKHWENHEIVSKFINSFWVKPLPSEYPENFLNVEQGCYW